MQERLARLSSKRKSLNCVVPASVWYFLIVLLQTTTACSLDSDAVTWGEGRLIYDHPGVQRLLAEETSREAEQRRFRAEKHSHSENAARVEDMRKHPERYIQGRREFLNSMERQPSIKVPDRTNLRTLGKSQASCLIYPHWEDVWVHVRVTSGALKGQEGWICQTSIQSASAGWP
jgi:hypothetical protein